MDELIKNTEVVNSPLETNKEIETGPEFDEWFVEGLLKMTSVLSNRISNAKESNANANYAGLSREDCIKELESMFEKNLVLLDQQIQALKKTGNVQDVLQLEQKVLKLHALKIQNLELN